MGKGIIVCRVREEEKMSPEGLTIHAPYRQFVEIDSLFLLVI